MNVIHRDIAARNILVGKNWGIAKTTKQNSKTISLFLKIMIDHFSTLEDVYVSDFGLSRVKAIEQTTATTKQSFGPIGVSSILN